jgi:uncharacterized protein
MTQESSASFAPQQSASKAPLTRIVLKLASRCNLNCSYCYVYNKGDTSWRERPPLMTAEVASKSVKRIRDHCEQYGLKEIRISFHGGETCLFGAANFDRLASEISSALAGLTVPRYYFQTNALLINDQWCEALKRHNVAVGVSLDGPPEVNDRFRVNKHGKGSHAAVLTGLHKLLAAGIRTELLTVVQLGTDGRAVHRHLASLGPSAVTYLLPDFTHDSIGPLREMHGVTPVADFLINVFDEWLCSDWEKVRVGDLWNIIRILNGAPSKLETYGSSPPLYVFVETDGAIEGLDCLRVCDNGFAATGLNVFDDDLQSVAGLSAVQFSSIFQKPPLSAECERCREKETCGGGYLPHRYSRRNGFANPSVWCADIKKLFGHIRHELKIPPNPPHVL